MKWCPARFLAPGSAAPGPGRIWEKILECVWEIGKSCWKIFTPTMVQHRSHWREELISTASATGFSLFFFILFFFHLCFQKIHCFFFLPGGRSSFWSINSSTSQSDGATLKICYGDVSSDSVAKVVSRFELKAGLMFLLSHSSY